MKKKGLIISTVVMVVVLIASLTTATYAWFTTSASTSIQGFDVSVAAGNVMNIGLNKQGYTTYSASATPDNFVSGACEYVADPTNGQFAAGYWTGEVESLGSTITHNIKWSTQNKAVGFSSDATVGTDAKNATFANTKLITQTGWTHAVKAMVTQPNLLEMQNMQAQILELVMQMVTMFICSLVHNRQKRFKLELISSMLSSNPKEMVRLMVWQQQFTLHINLTAQLLGMMLISLLLQKKVTKSIQILKLAILQ